MPAAGSRHRSTALYTGAVKLDVRAPLSFVRSAVRERDRLALAFALLIGVHGACVAAIGLSPDVAGFFMRRFHLRTQSFAAWAATAAMPWMYNFENRARVSDVPLSAQQLDAGVWLQENHQPARTFTFADGRARFLVRPGVHYFYLETRYREQVVRTAYALDVPVDAPVNSARVQRLWSDE
jgi:hypothetical protein